jgi:hypothetical protein
MASDFQMSDVGGLKGDWGLMLRRGLGAKLWGLHQALKLFYFRLDEVDVVRVSHIFTINFTDPFHPQLTRVGEIRIIPTL